MEVSEDDWNIVIKIDYELEKVIEKCVCDGCDFQEALNIVYGIIEKKEKEYPNLVEVFEYALVPTKEHLYNCYEMY